MNPRAFQKIRSPASLGIMISAVLAAWTFSPVTAGAIEKNVEETFEFFEKESVVVTAARREQPVWESPAASEVITAEEIRASGAVHLWDFMRFRAGMDVIEGRSGEGNRALVSVRGFPAEFVDNLLVLVDGRSVYTALSGGAVWEQIPVQIQDIERIEIVRGPNAALYGSNAGLGVVNILTRKPKSSGTVLAEAMGGNRGLHREQFGFEKAGTQGGGRFSFAHKGLDGNPTPADVRAHDYLHSYKGNFRGFWTPTRQSNLELFLGGTWDEMGVFDSATNPHGWFKHHFQMIKSETDLGSDSSVQTLLSRRDDIRRYEPSFGGLLAVREVQYDAEVVHHFRWMEDLLQTTYGGNLRYFDVDSEEIFSGNPKQKNAIQRGFVSQSWRVLPQMNLVGALSVERSDSGATQPAYQFAAVAHPHKSHAFRASYALAPTIPTLYEKAANQRANAFVALVGNPDLKPQKLRSYEAGYQGSFQERRVLFETNLFYLDIEDMSEAVVQSYAPLFTLTFDNGNRALARGAEVKWSYRWAAQRSLTANYTYESITDARGAVNVVQGTPNHKVNLGGILAIARGFTFSFNAGYKDKRALYSQASGRTLAVEAGWRLDGRLAWVPRRDWEIFLACQNMTESRHVEFADGFAVPRTYQAGLSVKIGD